MGWPIIVALVIGIPIVLFVPALVWMAVASGLSAVIRENLRRRMLARRARVVKVVEPESGK